MADTKGGSTRRRRYDSLLLHIDPLNPHERIRDGANPVGIKNVGNTCWFSAVVQSLYHLPVFRNVLLHANLDDARVVNGEVPESERDQALSPAVAFVKELRDLFALLLGSRRKYVDPTKAVQKLKSTFASSASNTAYQQDVSEFNHLLMEWLEEAFKTDSPALNPILELFYGKFSTTGMNEGKEFKTDGPFGARSLQVGGFPNLHASLDGSMVQREIEPVNASSGDGNGGSDDVKSEQETWFRHLSPVLILELSRFEFSPTEAFHRK
ncbi:ubiquitin carboxyl-terminal hydrolase 25-like isoform X4 [Oscarella lobularis]|uniref:ubiquitin carboxyl-terminal hydrolase 25-like isoform X4 n=1 Tax=Oscarella lobularis TaxID=121494 RepID=UPI0033131B6B